MSIPKGSRVEWHVAGTWHMGKVIAVYTHDIREVRGGKRILRIATDACPAYLIEMGDGFTLIKSHSELTRC
ncbi:HVA1 family protein [Hyphomonas beringensis]|uniref:HVA1 family protein n=1 Tax=Hyphomonas beringensis TaxID=1280946 RepID=UPI003BAF7870